MTIFITPQSSLVVKKPSRDLDSPSCSLTTSMSNRVNLLNCTVCALSHIRRYCRQRVAQVVQGSTILLHTSVKWGFLICSDGKRASLNKLSKAMRDSPRRVFLNSTTQDRTPWDDLSRLVGALILDRLSGSLRSASLMSLIARIVFVFAMSDSPG